MLEYFVTLWVTFFLAITVLAMGEFMTTKNKHQGWFVASLLGGVIIFTIGGVI